MSRTVSLVAALCAAEVLSMTGFAAFPALLPTFQAEWGLTNTDAGWISGIYYAGYLGGVPVLVSLTDRVDPRRVYLVCVTLTAVVTLGFALIAEGFWTALVLRALAGLGLAGTYMPGLKALSDHVEAPRLSRMLAFYTSSFGIGASLSYLLAGEIEAWLDWHWAFGLAALGPLAAMGLVLAALPGRPPPAGAIPDTRLLDFRPVLRRPAAMAYILAYCAHNWELFGLRSWIVVFFAFSQAQQADGAAGWLAPAALASIVNVIGVPSSILGNELAVRLGRRRMVIAYMTLSALLASLVGFTAALPFALVFALTMLYSVFVNADSASITAGAVINAPYGYRGATMAMHACIGFMGAFLGPLAVGVVLDLTGGGLTALSWGLAFVTFAVGVAMGPLVLITLGRRGS
ncbi:MAG: MFS transporter [Kiloniellales bacterium]